MNSVAAVPAARAARADARQAAAGHDAPPPDDAVRPSSMHALFKPSGVLLLAWRNLSHDRARFAVTLIGVVFSVALMGIQMGLLVGFARTASGLIDAAAADLWVVPYATANADIAGRLLQRREIEARSVPGVRQAESYLVQFAFLKTPDGRTETVSMVGFDPASRMGAPAGVSEQTLRALQIEDGVLVDRLYMHKLGIERLGQVFEINGHRARVVGFTNGIRSFTQAPYVFTTFTRATRFVDYAPNETTYVMLQLRADADADAIRRSLNQRLSHVDVLTTSAFAGRAQYYWLVTTGAGFALLIAAALGMVVGTVIVGQTLYSSTIDRIGEYATLRAMGASIGWLRRIVLAQALLSALLGFAAGIVVVWVAAQLSRLSTVLVALPWWLALLLALLTTTMCALGAWLSIRRLARIEPASVFQ